MTERVIQKRLNQILIMVIHCSKHEKFKNNISVNNNNNGEGFCSNVTKKKKSCVPFV